jgi:hypothetical protein
VRSLLLVLPVALGIVIATALTSCSSIDQNQARLEPTPQPTDVESTLVEPTAVLSSQAAPTLVASPTFEAPTPAPTSPPVVASRFERLVKPFLDEARRRRQAQAAADPTYWTRVDPKLNETRLNFLLFGYGETHEPPLTERAFIGSLTLFSYDYRSHTVDLVSLTHDIRAPEIERYLRTKTGQETVGPIKLDRAYDMGGFPLMGRTLEDATGLAVDFQLAFDEDAIAGATDNVFGGLDVDVPLPFAVNAFYYQGKKYPAGSFAAGPQHLNGLQVIQFIKTVPVEEHYDPRLEHNARKHQVFRALMDSLQRQVGDVGFLARGALFFGGQVMSNTINYDFDLRALLLENLGQMIRDRDAQTGADSSVPSIARTVYVVDPGSGDGGVQWVRANAKTNPVTRRDLELNHYGETAMEVPYSGDPYAENLVTGYWTDVRKLVAVRLLPGS